MLIILGLVALFIVFLIISNKTEYKYYFISDSIFALSVICLGIFLICSIFILVNLIDKDAETASYQQQYESLTYQLENIDTLYANSRANDKKELYNQIQEWNQTIAAGRARHNNLWINWFYPVNFNEFDFIELK